MSIAVAVILSGCSSFQSAMPGTTLSDANVLAILDIINLSEIDSADLAKQKASSEEVKMFASRMLKVHTAMLQESRQLAQVINIDPEPPALASTVGKRHQKMMEELRGMSGSDFDQAYLKYQMRMHEQVIDLIQHTADSVDDLFLQMHLKHARGNLISHLTAASALEQQIVARNWGFVSQAAVGTRFAFSVVGLKSREGDTMSQASAARHLHQALFNLADALDEIDTDSIEATKLDTAYRLIEEVERHQETVIEDAAHRAKGPRWPKGSRQSGNDQPKYTGQPLTQSEVCMLFIHPIVSTIAGGALLWAGLVLSDVALSSEKMPDNESGKTVQGTVLRIEGPNYFIKTRGDGKEVRLHIDKHTKIKALGVNTGDHVMAKIDDQNHVESISMDRDSDQHVPR
jgi:putative membrane protein